MRTYDVQGQGSRPVDRMVATDGQGRQVCLVDAADIFCELRAECARHLGEGGFDLSGAMGRELEGALAYVGVQVATGALAVDDAEAAVVMWLSLAMASMAGDMYEDLLDYTFSPQRLDEIAASVDTRMRQ